MADKTERQHFEKLLHEMFGHIWNVKIDHPILRDTVGDLMRDVLQAFDFVNPERLKGLWVVETETDIKRGRNAISGYKCNKCGYFVPWDFTHKSPFFIEEYNFCPHCGVDMRREQK